MKVLTILVARPQFIKAGSVSREILLQRESGIDITEVIVHTGQHYDANMSDVFFEEMQLPQPNYFLGMGGKTHGAMTGQMIEKIEEILLQEMPDWVMVYGDTNSTLAGAIAASKLNIKIAHVEAGLRSFNMRMPEEVNRILTDRISSLLFCPTQAAVDNLNNEGLLAWSDSPRALIVGDVMLDGACFYRELAYIPKDLPFSDDFLLCTIHREENTSDHLRLRSIFEALNSLSSSHNIIIPLHPRTKKIVNELGIFTSNLTIIDPVGYLNMLWLIDHAKLVLTDSGGLQKEAFFYSKPCITMRDQTEWIELIDCGANLLVGVDPSKIFDSVNNFQSIFSNVCFDSSIYGGSASQLIVSELLNNV